MKTLDTFLKGPIMQKLLVLLFFSFAAHTALAQAGDKAKMERERQEIQQEIRDLQSSLSKVKGQKKGDIGQIGIVAAQT